MQNNIGRFQKHYIRLSSSNYMIYFCEILEFDKLIHNEKKQICSYLIEDGGGEKWAVKGRWRDI